MPRRTDFDVRAEQNGTLRRHSSPPPAERTRGAGEQPVPAIIGPGVPAFVAPAGPRADRGVVEQSATPRSFSRPTAGAPGGPGAIPENSVELAAIERTP